MEAVEEVATVLRRIKVRVSPIPVEQVLLSYSGAKRKIYEQAAARLAVGGYNSNMARISMFIKPDKYPEEEIDTKAPRAIQYRTPEYNLLLGKYLKPYEHALYSLLGHCIMKGKNQKQRAEAFLDCIMAVRDPVVVVLDHSRFDAHVSTEMLKVEHACYKRAYRSRELAALLREQIHNRGRTKHGIYYRVEGTRMSGDLNTGLGNSLLNYGFISVVLARLKIKGRFILDGDDAVLVVPRTEACKITGAEFARFGMVAKMEVREWWEVEFCQCRLVLRPYPVFIRDPRRILSKSSVTIHKWHTEAQRRAHFRAICSCEVVCNPGQPIARLMGAWAVGRQLWTPELTYKAEQEAAMPKAEETLDGSAVFALPVDELERHLSDPPRFGWFPSHPDAATARKRL